nr:MAG TPA: NADAR protein [Caudoviricetes sp.]DAX78463.1 MAG TPA: NADAR protein [Caudoviricetes sp.]
MKIDNFKGKYFFLSNFYMADVEYNGIKYSNNEAAFQAQKCPERAKEFSALDPSQAKRKGRKIKLRPDWENVKYGIMFDIVIAKFKQNPELLDKLIKTGTSQLVEGNTWGDTTWGVYRHKGKNYLGRILMQVRALLGGK